MKKWIFVIFVFVSINLFGQWNFGIDYEPNPVDDFRKRDLSNAKVDSIFIVGVTINLQTLASDTTFSMLVRVDSLGQLIDTETKDEISNRFVQYLYTKNDTVPLEKGVSTPISPNSFFLVNVNRIEYEQKGDVWSIHRYFGKTKKGETLVRRTRKSIIKNESRVEIEYWHDLETGQILDSLEYTYKFDELGRVIRSHCSIPPHFLSNVYLRAFEFEQIFHLYPNGASRVTFYGVSSDTLEGLNSQPNRDNILYSFQPDVRIHKISDATIKEFIFGEETKGYYYVQSNPLYKIETFGGDCRRKKLNSTTNLPESISVLVDENVIKYSFVYSKRE